MSHRLKRKKAASSKAIIALGAMTFGGQTSAGDADRMLGMFLDDGHSWVDTAFIYTGGKSERIVGRLLKGKRRREVFLATKAYPDKLGKGKPRGLTPGSVRGQLETSLKRLGTDCVDLFYLHAPDNKTPLEVTLATCEELRREGKVRHLGLSNYAAWQVAECVGICRRNDWREPIVYQGMYNAITRDIERECITACRHFGLKFIAYNPLAGGLLTGKYASLDKTPVKGRFSNQHYRDRFWNRHYFDAVAMIGKICRRKRIAPAEVAVRWVLRNSLADSLLLGASKVGHLKENLAACRKGKLPPEICKVLDEAWEIARPVCQRYFRD